MRITAIAGALLVAFLPGAAFAAEVESTKSIDKRQETQDSRIDKGRKSGDLTKGEAKRLEKGQRKVDRAEARMEKDGKMTKGERKRLEEMQDSESRKIQNQRKDDAKR